MSQCVFLCVCVYVLRAEEHKRSNLNMLSLRGPDCLGLLHLVHKVFSECVSILAFGVDNAAAELIREERRIGGGRRRSTAAEKWPAGKDGTGQDEERYHRMERGQMIEMMVKMMVAGTEMQHVFNG